MSDGTGTAPTEPPTTLITTAEPPTTPMTTRESAAGPATAPDVPAVRAEVATDGDLPAAGEAPTSPRPVWPGLSAAGLPTRVPRSGDEEQIKEAFADSWEAPPTGPTPLTKAPFVPTFPAQAARRSSWSVAFDPAARPTAAEPPEPKEPPQPVEPPEPRQPPAPPSPPTPPGPPGPTPFPTPTPAPIPPEPVPAPTPPGPVPVPPPAPPVPTPPPPFPTPPGPVPPPPSIVPGRPVAAGARAGALYPSGTYSELATEPITGVTPQSRRGQDLSGTLAGHLAIRGEKLVRRRERRRKVRTAVWVTGTLLVFAIGILIVVNILAGDFIRSLFDTFASWAG